MKKLNKKGFTLAELLIVIAIIAILIAIAIPAFSGALDSAKLQTDHANIRSAYAMVQMGTLQGGVLVNDTTGDLVKPTFNTKYYFQQDGSLIVSTGTDAEKNAYVTKSNGSDDKCAASAGCLNSTQKNHKENQYITVTYTAASSTTSAKWSVEFETKS